MTSTTQRVREALSWLERRGSKRTREEMLTRYGITAPKAFGVSVGTIQQLAKRLGHDHELAAALWGTGWYEARLLASFVGEAERVTPAEMDRWARDFDNWGVVDTVCFHLWDRTAHAWRKIDQWSTRRGEYQKRGAFVLLACVALHDKESNETKFTKSLALIERAADDDRNFVKKAVSWALRSVGRRSPALNTASVALSRRLAQSDEPGARWVGKDALRELASAKVRRSAARRSTLTSN